MQSKLTAIARRLRRSPAVTAIVRRMFLRDRHTPIAFLFDVTTICNAACIFCSYPTLVDAGMPTLRMDERTFDQGLNIMRAVAQKNDLRKYGVSLTPMTGDFFVNPIGMSFLKRLIVIREVEWVDIVTNAIGMTQQKVDELLKTPELHKLNLSISIGGLDAASYADMYQVNQFNTVAKNTQYLLTRLKRSWRKVPVDIRLRVRTKAGVSVQQMKQTFNKVRYPFVVFSIMDEFFDIDGLGPGSAELKLREVRLDKSRPCAMITTSKMAVHPDRSVTTCYCHYSRRLNDLSLTIGTVDDAPEVLLSAQRAIADAWRQGNVPAPCIPCGLYEAG